MKNLLVFRSAKHPVVRECIQQISREYMDCTIWLCIQEECVSKYTEYRNIQPIVFPNGMFNYERTMKSSEIIKQLETIKFDEVYIPYSTQTPNCEEIEKIIRRIVKKRKAIYFNSEGNISKKGIHTVITPKIVMESIYKAIDYHVMKIIYMYFARRRKNDC